ncbi:MAG: TolC family protein [Acidobacteria bacterium]|nr:TolC family protein [Acidobacteriota bacterium]
MYRASDACLSQRCGGLVLTVLLLAATASAAGPGALTLSAALRAVASGSRAADVAKLQVAEARAATRAVRSSELPSIRLTGGFVDRDSELVAVFGPFMAPLGGDTYWQYQASARYLLWDGGVRKASIEAARATEGVAELGGAASIVQAEIEGLDAYLRAMGARARRRAIARRIAAVKAHLVEVNDLFAQGMVARNDLLETQVRLRQVRDQDLAAADDEAAAVRALARLMGRDPSTRISLPAALQPPPPLRWTEAQLLQAALERSPDIRVLKARLEAAGRRVEVTTGCRRCSPSSRTRTRRIRTCSIPTQTWSPSALTGTFSMVEPGRRSAGGPALQPAWCGGISRRRNDA